MLARYVREHYEQAVLIARAQTELRKRDALEENQSTMQPDNNSSDEDSKEN